MSPSLNICRDAFKKTELKQRFSTLLLCFIVGIPYLVTAEFLFDRLFIQNTQTTTPGHIYSIYSVFTTKFLQKCILLWLPVTRNNPHHKSCFVWRVLGGDGGYIEYNTKGHFRNFKMWAKHILSTSINSRDMLVAWKYAKLAQIIFQTCN